MISNEKGFTLIEVIASVTILALIAAPIASIFMHSFLSNVKGRDITIATVIAQEKIEELKAISFEELALKRSDVFDEEIYFQNIKFKRNTYIQNEGANLIQIIVEVRGKGCEIKLFTYRGNFK